MKTSIRYEVRPYGEEYAVYSIVETILCGDAENYVCKGSLEYCKDTMNLLYDMMKRRANEANQMP